MPPFFILLLGSYAIFDVLSLGLGEKQRIYYGIVCLLVGLQVALQTRRAASSYLSNHLCRLWIATSIIGCVTGCLGSNYYTIYYAGDLISFSLPLLFLFYANRNPDIFVSKVANRWMMGLLMGSTLLALYHPDPNTNRFAEPSYLLMAYLWILGSTARTQGAIVLCLVGSAAVFLLTLLSGARFALILWMLLGAVPVILGFASAQAKLAYYAAIVLSVLALGLGILGQESLQSLQDLRVTSIIEKLREGEFVSTVLEDGSMRNRFLEADDALQRDGRRRVGPDAAWLRPRRGILHRQCVLRGSRER